MPDKEQVKTAAAVAARHFKKDTGLAKTAVAGFVLSLLPVPGISQAGTLLERWASTKDGRRRFDAMCNELEKLGVQFEGTESVEEAVAKVASLVAENIKALNQMMSLSETLGKEFSEFVMETDEGSYQELAQSIVEAAQVLISATRGSTNVIEDSEIRSSSTRLHASGGSRNFVDRSRFTGSKGSIEMDGISTEGDIHVSESSLGFGQGGKIIFGGGNPNLVTGSCPICQGKISADKRQLVGYTHIQCPTCHSNLQLPPG